MSMLTLQKPHQAHVGHPCVRCKEPRAIKSFVSVNSFIFIYLFIYVSQLPHLSND